MRYTWRYYLILFVFAGLFAALMWRAFELTVLQRDFLLSEGEKRSTRVQAIPAHRGMITDRLGDPLAISAPVASIWMNPSEMQDLSKPKWQALAKQLSMSLGNLKKHYKINILVSHAISLLLCLNEFQHKNEEGLLQEQPVYSMIILEVISSLDEQIKSLPVVCN